MSYQFHWEVLLAYRGLLMAGLLATLRLVALSFIASVFLGVLTAIGRSFPPPAIKALFACYVEFFRNVPPIVQFFFWSFAVGLDVFPAAFVALSVFTSTYIAEIVRAGIASIPRAQTEAGRSAGMTSTQLIVHVILPQALIRVIPPLAIEFINLVKNSSIAMTIGYAELTFATQEIESETFRGFEAATAVTILYVLLALVVVLATHFVERLVRLDVRKG